MASKIRVLDEQTINQIAAGEVVEGPASVVKELVENALDAQATHIRIEIKGGGRQLIRVIDNGCGMSQDDALLCFERHATSKVKYISDLNDLATMGFRGEALAAISSVSKVMLMTRPHENSLESTLGTTVSVEGGKVKSCISSPTQPGTLIEVSALFYNVPARRNFMKAPSHDQTEILKIITLLSLAHPEVSFDLIINDRPALQAKAEAPFDFKKRLIDVLGEQTFEGAYEIDSTYGPYKIKGFLASVDQSRQNRTGQYLFINKRPVVSNKISFVVKEAYGASIDRNRHPQFVLMLEMNPELVDVNVHPQKREVRFRQESALCDALGRLCSSSIFKSVPTTPEANIFSENEVPFENTISSSTSYQSNQIGALLSKPAPQRDWEKTLSRLTLQDENYLKEGISHHEKADQKDSHLFTDQALYQIVGIFGQYIFMQASLDSPIYEIYTEWKKEESLIIVDMSLARRRITYETFLSSLENSQRMNQSQSLLFPITLEFSSMEFLILRKNISLLESLGIGVREFGVHSCIIDQWPVSLDNVLPQEFIKEFIAICDSEEKTSSQVLMTERKKLVARMCSRMTTSKHSVLSNESALTLIKQLMLCQEPMRCPFGHPTMIRISRDEIAKRFSSKDSLC